MRKFVTSIVLMAGLCTRAGAESFPADPVKHLDGYWYGEDRKIEIEVLDGVATVKVNETEDPYVVRMAMSPGTVVARFTGSKITSSNSAQLNGQCRTMLNTTQSDLVDCTNYLANYVMSLDHGKSVDRLKISTVTYMRKKQMAEWMWQYRK